MSVKKRTLTEYKIEVNATAGDLARALDGLPQDANIHEAEVQQFWYRDHVSSNMNYSGIIRMTIEMEEE